MRARSAAVMSRLSIIISVSMATSTRLRPSRSISGRCVLPNASAPVSSLYCLSKVPPVTKMRIPARPFEMIRQTPGTISLGQGVVHYGPPKEAIEAAGEALSDPVTHEYQDGAGSPALLERLAVKLRRENGIDVSRGRLVMVTAGANMAFVH